MRVRLHLGYDSLGLFGIRELYGLPKPADQVSSVREGSAHNESPAIGPVAPETRRNHYRVSPPQDTHSPSCADHEGQLITGDAPASNVRTGSVPGRWEPWHISERWPTPRPPCKPRAGSSDIGESRDSLTESASNTSASHPLSF